MQPCATCPGPDYCERCPMCGGCSTCRCVPTSTTVLVLGRRVTCETCGGAIREGDRVRRYEDALVHDACPERAQA